MALLHPSLHETRYRHSPRRHPTSFLPCGGLLSLFFGRRSDPSRLPKRFVRTTDLIQPFYPPFESFPSPGRPFRNTRTRKGTTCMQMWRAVVSYLLLRMAPILLIGVTCRRRKRKKEWAATYSDEGELRNNTMDNSFAGAAR